MALVLDTGVLFAAMDRADADHGPCRDLLNDASEVLVLPSPVLVEVDYWISQRLQPSVLIDLLDEISGGALTVENLQAEDYARVQEICGRYADSDVGFVDAAVLAIVERLGERKLATLDHRHFAMMRPRHVDALELLPA